MARIRADAPRSPGDDGTVTQIWRIQLLVETDDKAEVAKLADAVARVACPEDPEHEHACRVPWYVVTSALSSRKRRAWRDELNR